MECHEGGDDEGEDACQDVGCHDKVAHLVIKGVWVAQCAGNDRIAGQHYQETSHRAMEQHVHEEFVVVEANAVCDPRAVMVHL